MISLNVQNIEKLIFYDKKLQSLLPEFKDTFNQWAFAMKFSAFKPTAKRAVMDLLNNLKKEHIEIIEKYFNSKVVIDKLDYHIVKDCKVALDELESLNETEPFYNVELYRDANHLYILSWR